MGGRAGDRRGPGVDAVLVVVATPVDVEPAVAPCEVKMSLSVQLMCDRDVPYGTGGVRLMVLPASAEDGQHAGAGAVPGRREEVAVKVVGVMAAFALARADVTRWLVAWYALTVVWIVVAGVAVVTVIDRVARRRLRRDQLQWPAALAVVGLALIVGHPGIWGAM